MLFRSTVESDLDRLLACTVTEPISWIPADRYSEELALHQYRPEWTWIAEDGGQILARALWWGLGDAEHPSALDCLYVHESVRDRTGLAAALLRAGHDDFAYHGAEEKPQYHLSLALGWRDDDAVVAALEWRQTAARGAGLTNELERLRYEWTPDSGVPEPTGRLVFQPEPDDDVFLDAFRRVASGSLDTTTQRDVEAFGVERQARDDMRLYRDLPGRRDWWRLAYTPEGALAGFAIATHNPYGPVVGYLGVVPELRGRRYIDEILGEITRQHAAAGATRIRAATDVTNVPMAAAFDRAGYRNDEVRMVLSAPPNRAV